MAQLALLLFCALVPDSGRVLLNDVHIHQQNGDVIGTEVTLEVLADGRVVGTLRHFEGSCDAQIVRLKGTLKRETLSASGSLPGGAVRLDGKLTRAQFVGRVRFELSRQTNAIAVLLPVVKAHRLCQ